MLHYSINLHFNFLIAISNEHFGLQLVVLHKRGSVKYSLNRLSKYRINNTIEISSEYCSVAVVFSNFANYCTGF